MKKVFTKIYKSAYKDEWFGDESRSGVGSSLHATRNIRNKLSNIVLSKNIKTILDAGCGDFNWMKNVELHNASYTGGDIVDSLIKTNKKRFPDVNFIKLDISSDKISKYDLIIIRDVLGHFSFESILKTLINIQSSGSKYLLTTSFINKRSWDIINIEDGQWRTINIFNNPFNFKPIIHFPEGCEEGNGEFFDKSLVLVEIDSMDLLQLKMFTENKLYSLPRSSYVV